jgi:hypothetical protein
MPSYLTSILLEFSVDPLSDTTPAWTDVTADCMGIEYWAGVDNEGDEPQPGGAVIRLRNTNRRWEPDYVAGDFYPNITTHRRFRLTLNDGTGATQEGLWYITEIAIDYPAGTAYSEVTLTCADGSEVLALDNLPALDPPDADSYGDVVDHDDPVIYADLDDQAGTQLGHRTVVRQWRKQNLKAWYGLKLKLKKPTKRIIGVYRASPLLDQPSLILGEFPGTAARFTRSLSQFAQIDVDASSFTGGSNFTLEAWVKLASTGLAQGIVSGPLVGGTPCFALGVSSTDKITYDPSDGSKVFGSALSADTIYHLAIVIRPEGYTAFVNGVNQGTIGSTVLIGTLDANPKVTIAEWDGANFADATIDEVAVYERSLSDAEILSHYTAGALRGYPQQTAGTRIADMASSDLWSEASIQTTGLTMHPTMKANQARLDEIAELARSEGPHTLFFFNGAGNPVYLGWDWMGSAAAYNTTQATFGDSGGEIGYTDIGLVYDNEVFNEVTASRELGSLVTVSDSASQTDKRRRVNTDYSDLLLSDDDDVNAIASDVLELFKEPALRPASLSVAGPEAVRQILDLDIGHMVRVKRRGTGGTPIDRICHILGKRKTLTADKHLTCTYSLSRGYNASLSEWLLGISGRTELNSTAVLA